MDMFVLNISQCWLIHPVKLESMFWLFDKFPIQLNVLLSFVDSPLIDFLLIVPSMERKKNAINCVWLLTKSEYWFYVRTEKLKLNKMEKEKQLAQTELCATISIVVRDMQTQAHGGKNMFFDVRKRFFIDFGFH